jgi:hypothetical protein
VSFTDALSKAKADFSKGPACTIATVLASHPEADQIRGAIADNSVPGTLIAKALTDSGVKIGSTPIQRHRRGACGCEAT